MGTLFETVVLASTKIMCMWGIARSTPRQIKVGFSGAGLRFKRIRAVLATLLVAANVGCAPYPVKPDVARTEEVSLAVDDIEVTLEPQFLLRKFAEALHEAHRNVETVTDAELVNAALPEGERALRHVLEPDARRRMGEQLNVTYLVLIGALYAHEGELEGPFVIFIGAWGVAKQELEASLGATVIELSSGEPLCQVTAEADATMVAAGWFFPFVVGPWAENDLNTIKGVAEEIGKAIVEDAGDKTVRVVIMAGDPGLQSRREQAQAMEERLSALTRRAEAGDAEAQLQLYYAEGRPNARLKWLCRAADQGYVTAQVEIGRLYWKGLDGLKQDLRRAYVWYSLAAQGGYKDWDVWELRSLKSRMTADQTIEATDMLDAWEPGQCERDLILQQ